MSQRKSVSIRPLLKFFLLTALAFIVMTAGWRFVADYASRPAGFVARVVLEMGFSNTWLRTTTQSAHHLEVETRIMVQPTPQQRAQAVAAGQFIPPNAVAEAVLEVDPARYGYGLPILLALLIAARSGKFLRKAVLGTLLLIPFQAFTIMMVLLKDLAFKSGAGAQLGYAQWQLELIAYGYQLGVLLIPTVAPIAIWLWLDNKYVTTVLLNGWFGKLEVAPAGSITQPAIAPTASGDPVGNPIEPSQKV